MTSTLNLVLDTNALFGTWAPYRWAQIRQIVEHAGGKIFIPEIVFYEIKHHWAQQFVQMFSQFETSEKRLNAAPSFFGFQLDPEARNHLLKSIEKARTSKYSDQDFSEHLISMFGHVLVIEKNSSVPQHLLIDRYQNQHRPFKIGDENKNKDGRIKNTGWQDSLIWESTIAYARKTSGQIVFISDNNDFKSLDKTGLHPDLVEDLISAGLPDSKVVLFPNLSALLTDQQIEPVGKSVELMRSKKFLSDLVKQLEENPDLYFEIEFGIRELSESDFQNESDEMFVDLGYPRDFRIIRVDAYEQKSNRSLELSISLSFVYSVEKYVKTTFLSEDAYVRNDQASDFAILNLCCHFEDEQISNVRDVWIEGDSTTMGIFSEFKEGSIPHLKFESLSKTQKIRQFVNEEELNFCKQDFLAASGEGFRVPLLTPFSLLQKWDMLPE